ncbi:hypothetical protein SAMN05444398_105122 [Roseovarius pacificus]|uniref:Peptidase propeptide and YPEB domain-containing protein n=2 Tax=Roseovarius pacificus TaxID=337701 RepID=A0A1M7D598_9RHOB|nr:hypothetical protein SAMN05444398_105122 [Roseovarius pacificus]
MIRYLRLLVTILTGTMIAGLLVIIFLFVTRLGDRPAAPPMLPDTIALPDGAKATAFTQGGDWYAVVTGDDRILIYDRAGGTLRQVVDIE